MAAKVKQAAPDETQSGQPNAALPLVSAADFAKMDGQEYGGSADILLLKEGEAAGPIEYQGHQEITTELGPTTVHLGADKDGNQWRLPIQATFIRCIDQAKLSHGDKFYIMRQDDQIKKRGKGSGKPMAIYAIKVVGRVGPDGKALPF